MADDAWNPTRRELEPNTKRLFEDCAWLYAFCRERLFRDHTEEITQALFPDGNPSEDTSVVEVGCGPGFYARRLAQRYPALRMLGIDRSSRLLEWAQSRASSDALTNCRFQHGDVECISACIEPVDAVISSRLLLVVGNRNKVMAEIFHVLKPGGRLFLVEPTANIKTQLPLSAMRLVTRFIYSAHREAFPQNAKILSSLEFEDLVRSQPWSKVSIQMYGDYQCAVCHKSGDTVTDIRELEMNAAGIAVTGPRGVA